LRSPQARLAIGAIALLAWVAAALPVEQADAEVWCPKVQLFNAVGSGGKGNRDVTDTLRDAILPAERQADADPDLFHAWRVDYPAVSVKSHTGLGAVRRTPGRYHDSVVAGKKWLREHVKQKIDHCGAKTKIVLSGFSQGAQVVGDVYQELERSGQAGYVFGVVLFGDPYFNPKKDGRGSSQGKWRHGNRSGALGQRPVYGRHGRAYLHRVRSYCHKRDPVCQSGALSFGDHSNYATTGHGHPGEATDAGRWLSTRLRAALAPPKQPSAAPGCVPATNVSVIIDDSGSMDINDPDAIRRRAAELLITKPASQARTIGAVEFGGDAATLFAPGVVGSSPAAMLGALNALADDGVGEDDEGGTDYNAAFEAARSAQPEATARIFLTDGEHNDSDYLDGHAGGPRTYVVGLDFGSSGVGEEEADLLARIASETGGRYFPLKRQASDTTARQVARLQPVFNQIDALLACQAAPQQVSRTFARPGQIGRPVTVPFRGWPAMEAVLSWSVLGMDCDLVRAVVRNRRGQVIADLRGKQRIGRSKKRRKRLVVRRVENDTFETVTILRPRRGWTLTIWVKARVLPTPAPMTVQVRRVKPPPPAPQALAPTPSPNPNPNPAPPPGTVPEPPGKRLIVDNRVTNGMGMREDPIPARLTTQPWKFCGSRGCNINGTERVSGQSYEWAICQTQGERTTNGHDTDAGDDANPLRFESTRYYGVRLANGVFGYVSEVWIRGEDRGGLGLRQC
jgi:Cutinase/von Willebrand factor type A domain